MQIINLWNLFCELLLSYWYIVKINGIKIRNKLIPQQSEPIFNKKAFTISHEVGQDKDQGIPSVQTIDIDFQTGN